MDVKPVLNEIRCAVWIVTYNHEKFIEYALKSVISQEVNFNYRIFLSDDKSTDRTGEICMSYARKYPDLIDLVINPENLGHRANGKATYSRCFGSGAKYIALLEGDDYWTDPLKLQKQVDLLEANPEYVGCFHNTEERYEADDTKPSFLYCGFPSAKKVSFEDLAYRNLIPTCSVVFRNGLFGDFPAWYFNLGMGDWPLHILNSQFGDYWYIPKIMGVHRLHSGGVWMPLAAEKSNKDILDAYDAMIANFKENETLSGKLRAGKKEFLDSLRPAQSKRTFKSRAKSALVRIIDGI